METLILGDKEIAQLKSLSRYAIENPLSMDNMLDTINDPSNSPGIKPEYQVSIPSDFKVVFTIDEYPEYNVRHLSVSRDKKDILPSPEAVSMIMKELGFKNKIKDCKVALEKLEPGYTAINVGEIA